MANIVQMGKGKIEMLEKGTKYFIPISLSLLAYYKSNAVNIGEQLWVKPFSVLAIA